jgi:hypothetical protein
MMMPSDVVHAHAEYSVCPTKIEIVEDLHRFRVPRVSRGRDRPVSVREQPRRRDAPPAAPARCTSA